MRELNQRRCFNFSRRLLLRRRDELSNREKATLDVMLCFSDKLAQGYALKETFYRFMAAPDRIEADRRLGF